MEKRTVFIGSVESSKVALETLIENKIKIDLVCSLSKEVADNVSDYYPIHRIAAAHNIPYVEFTRINSPDIVSKIKTVEPDFIFVIGLSQIIEDELLNVPKEYIIGFHPTPLPKHRGRAAIPWQILLGVRESKVSLFKMDQGMDSGHIICQYPYEISSTDYASDVYHKVCSAMRMALEKSLPDIYNGTVRFEKQNHDEATYLLARYPEDGYIDWSCSGKEIETLIRAVSRPYPGAFSFYMKKTKVIFWRARLEENDKYIGIPGQIAWISPNNEIRIVAKDSLLVVTDYEVTGDPIRLRVGHRFQ